MRAFLESPVAIPLLVLGWSIVVAMIAVAGS